MGLGTGQVTINSTSPTLIASGKVRNLLTVVHNGGSDVYLGDPTVTTTTGSLLAGIKGNSFWTSGNDAYYAITPSGTALLSFTEQF